MSHNVYFATYTQKYLLYVTRCCNPLLSGGTSLRTYKCFEFFVLYHLFYYCAYTTELQARPSRAS